MAQNLGVTFNEKDLSKSVSALPIPGGALAGYTVKGPTDKAYLARSEEDLRRLVGQPQAVMGDEGSMADLNMGLHYAFRFLRAGLPIYFKRAIPTTIAGGDDSDGKAFVLFQKEEAASLAANAIKAVAKGHGAYYNGLSIFVKGIESVQAQVALSAGSAVSLGDNVLPGSLVITDPGDSADTDDDLDITYAERTAGAKTLNTTLSGDAIVTYEDATLSNYTSINAVNAVTVNITYERTTTDRLVRVFICDDGEADPVTNNYENYLVSYKAAGKDEGGNACFIEDKINGTSEIIDIAVGSSYVEATLPVYYKAVTGDITDAAGPLASGADGTYAASDADITIAFREYDPLQKNGRYYDILYMFDSGYHDNVKKAIADIAATKLFPHVYLDPDKGLFIEQGNRLISGLVASTIVNKLVEWRNGIGNKEFASLSGSCWGRVVDEFNAGRQLWVGPTYEVGAAAIIVDSTLGSWNSVMGPRRGVTNFEKLAINLYDYRNELNAKQVNPMVIDERGIQMFYGNKTLKVVATAMQQSHARKTRSRISREMLYSALDYVSENLVNSTYNGLRDEFEIIFEAYGAGLESYSLVVGPPATSSDDVNQQRMVCTAGMIFNQIAEEVKVITTVFRNGTDLSVNVVEG